MCEEKANRKRKRRESKEKANRKQTESEEKTKRSKQKAESKQKANRKQPGSKQNRCAIDRVLGAENNLLKIYHSSLPYISLMSSYVFFISLQSLHSIHFISALLLYHSQWWYSLYSSAKCILLASVLRRHQPSVS